MVKWFSQSPRIRLIHIKSPPEIIRFAYLETKYGRMMMGVLNPFTVDSKDQVAICLLHFVDKDVSKTYDEVQQRWPKSILQKDEASVQLVAEKLFEGDKENSEVVPIAILGTEFQKSVWSALVDLKSAETYTYSQLADRMGCPKAIRAVANAVAKNEDSLPPDCVPKWSRLYLIAAI